MKRLINKIKENNFRVCFSVQKLGIFQRVDGILHQRDHILSYFRGQITEISD